MHITLSLNSITETIQKETITTKTNKKEKLKIYYTKQFNIGEC